MAPITLQRYYGDPELRFRLEEAAHRERARLVKAGLDWLRERLKPQLQLQPGRWIERLG